MSSTPLISCGGRIRTCDLQVMSLASYQLLHSAMFDFASAKVVILRETTKYFLLFFLIFKFLCILFYKIAYIMYLFSVCCCI